MKPRALDLFCGAGGASVGLHRAGFEVVGVDHRPQPRYPFEFRQGDALEADVSGFDLIWASPPCQLYSSLSSIHRKDHPDLVGVTRDKLEASGTRWIIENVPGAPLRPDVILCGSMFGQSRLRRHRWFELSWPLPFLLPPCSHRGRAVGVYGHGGEGYNPVSVWREVMGIDWMERHELSQAVPPAYSEWLGRRALRALKEAA